MALPSALACHGIDAPTSRIWTESSGRNTWWTISTLGPYSTPTCTASRTLVASDSAHSSERARSSWLYRKELPSCSRAGPRRYLPVSRSCSTNCCASRVRSSPYTVALARPRRSASSVTPRRACSEPSALRMRPARTTDWIMMGSPLTEVPRCGGGAGGEPLGALGQHGVLQGREQQRRRGGAGVLVADAAGPEVGGAALAGLHRDGRAHPVHRGRAGHAHAGAPRRGRGDGFGRGLGAERGRVGGGLPRLHEGGAVQRASGAAHD